MREVPFPMRDPYSPATRARIPVPGLNRFPGRYNVTGEEFYGIDSPVIVNAGSDAIVNAGGVPEGSGFAGFADAGFGFSPDTILPGPMVTPPDDTNDGGGIDWGAIIQAGIHAAPAIIQASEGGGAPYNYYQQGVGLPQTTPAGYTRNAQNQLVPIGSAYQLAGGVGAGGAQIANSLTNFITQNPLLVLGGVAAVFLLMMKPPGGRR